MTSTITQIASDLNEKVDNRFELVLKISEIAKKLLEESREKMAQDPFSTINTSPEKVIYQALIMQATTEDMGDGLIG